MNKSLLIVGAALAMVLGVAVQQMMRFDFQTVQGDKISWSELQGEWVVLNYFAEWCAPCLREVPELNEFHHQIQGKNIKLIAASYDALTLEELTALKQKYDMQFPVVRTDPEPNLMVPKPQQLPATFLISPEGKVEKKLLGEQTSETLFAAIAMLQSQAHKGQK
ncbi:peroxiredoxin family protein [Paraneptunicella aestuarii]|uniref:peroxiredoxin family protein n=1 Tax=Paraneptunicella aestuarii TaxID=2831148 RepID=UPI001E2F2656|nr:TlpA disulfide reductase family protein [Paraneptunicella aestuarii]